MYVSSDASSEVMMLHPLVHVIVAFVRFCGLLFTTLCYVLYESILR